MQVPDGVLVERAREGDPEAFDVLVRRHLGSAYAVAVSVVLEPADAEDVCQDAFLTALEQLDRCQPERFAGWLLTIVRNRAISWQRRRKVRRAEPLEWARANMTHVAHGHPMLLGSRAMDVYSWSHGGRYVLPPKPLQYRPPPDPTPAANTTATLPAIAHPQATLSRICRPYAGPAESST